MSNRNEETLDEAPQSENMRRFKLHLKKWKQAFKSAHSSKRHYTLNDAVDALKFIVRDMMEAGEWNSDTRALMDTTGLDVDYFEQAARQHLKEETDRAPLPPMVRVDSLDDLWTMTKGLPRKPLPGPGTAFHAMYLGEIRPTLFDEAFDPDDEGFSVQPLGDKYAIVHQLNGDRAYVFGGVNKAKRGTDGVLRAPTIPNGRRPNLRGGLYVKDPDYALTYKTARLAREALDRLIDESMMDNLDEDVLLAIGALGSIAVGSGVGMAVVRAVREIQKFLKLGQKTAAEHAFDKLSKNDKRTLAVLVKKKAVRENTMTIQDRPVFEWDISEGVLTIERDATWLVRNWMMVESFDYELATSTLTATLGNGDAVELLLDEEDAHVFVDRPVFEHTTGSMREVLDESLDEARALQPLEPATVQGGPGEFTITMREGASLASKRWYWNGSKWTASRADAKNYPSRKDASPDLRAAKAAVSQVKNVDEAAGAIAQEILRQLGGGRFTAMTGAKNYLGSENSLSFKIGRNDSGITHVRITLDPSDTYTVTFSKVRGTNAKVVKELDGVHADALRTVFTMATGMATSLGMSIGRKAPPADYRDGQLESIDESGASLTAAQMKAAKSKVRAHYGLSRLPTDAEVSAEIANLRRRGRGNLDTKQGHLAASLQTGAQPIELWVDESLDEAEDIVVSRKQYDATVPWGEETMARMQRIPKTHHLGGRIYRPKNADDAEFIRELFGLEEDTLYEGSSSTPPYVYELFNAAGGSVMSHPAGWRVASRGKNNPGYGKPTDSNLAKLIAAYNTSLDDGGANDQLSGTFGRDRMLAVGGIVRRNGHRGEIVARHGLVPSRVDDSIDESKEKRIEIAPGLTWIETETGRIGGRPMRKEVRLSMGDDKPLLFTTITRKPPLTGDLRELRKAITAVVQGVDWTRPSIELQADPASRKAYDQVKALFARHNPNESIDEAGVGRAALIHTQVAKMLDGSLSDGDRVRQIASVNKLSTQQAKAALAIVRKHLDPMSRTGAKQSEKEIAELLAADESLDEAREKKISTKDPATMTGTQINKELDAIDAETEPMSSVFIEAGLGHVRYSDMPKAAEERGGDVLKLWQRQSALEQRRRALSIEIELRYGPGAPRRLPSNKRWGPRTKADEALDEEQRTTFGELSVGDRYAIPGMDLVFEKVSPTAYRRTSMSGGLTGTKSKENPSKIVVRMGPQAFNYSPGSLHPKPENVIPEGLDESSVLDQVREFLATREGESFRAPDVAATVQADQMAVRKALSTLVINGDASLKKGEGYSYIARGSAMRVTDQDRRQADRARVSNRRTIDYSSQDAAKRARRVAETTRSGAVSGFSADGFAPDDEEEEDESLAEETNYQGGYSAKRLNARGGNRLVLARGDEAIKPVNLKQARAILAKFLAANPTVNATVYDVERPFYIVLGEDEVDEAVQRMRYGEFVEELANGVEAADGDEGAYDVVLRSNGDLAVALKPKRAPVRRGDKSLGTFKFNGDLRRLRDDDNHAEARRLYSTYSDAELGSKDESLDEETPGESLARAGKAQAAHLKKWRDLASQLPDGTDLKGWVKHTLSGRDVFWIKGRKQTVDIITELGRTRLVAALNAAGIAAKDESLDESMGVGDTSIEVVKIGAKFIVVLPDGQGVFEHTSLSDAIENARTHARREHYAVVVTVSEALYTEGLDEKLTDFQVDIEWEDGRGKYVVHFPDLTGPVGSGHQDEYVFDDYIEARQFAQVEASRLGFIIVVWNVKPGDEHHMIESLDEEGPSEEALRKAVVPNKSVLIDNAWWTVKDRDLDAGSVVLTQSSWAKNDGEEKKKDRKMSWRALVDGIQAGRIGVTIDGTSHGPKQDRKERADTREKAGKPQTSGTSESELTTLQFDEAAVQALVLAGRSIGLDPSRAVDYRDGQLFLTVTSSEAAQIRSLLPA